MSGFKKATKQQAKLRAALFGPAGAGKTFSALRIAKGLGSKIAVIDTERGSASKYADRFDFDVLELGKDRSIDAYVSGISDAGEAGYDVLVIDSLSHAWQELLEEVEQLARAKYKGNTWSAWSDGTPRQRKLIDAILTYPGHVLSTMRSKTEWTTQEHNGRKTPVRVGLAPEQGKGIEYEMDLLLEMSAEHVCTVLKDRTGRFQDKLIDHPGEDFGKALAEWLNSGEAPPQLVNSTQVAALRKLAVARSDKADLKAWLKSNYNVESGDHLLAEHYAAVSERLRNPAPLIDPGNGAIDDDTDTNNTLAMFDQQEA